MSPSPRRSPVYHLTLMRLRELWRQPATMFWVFGFPIVLAIALGAAFSERGPAPIVIGAVRPLEPAVSAALGRAGVTVRALEPAAVVRELRAGRVALVLGPEASAGAAPLEYRYDPDRVEARLARAVVDEAVQRAAGRTDTAATSERPVREIGSRYIDFLVPGLIGMNLMTGALWGIGWSLADLRRRRLLRRLRAAPLRPSQLVAAIGLARAVVVPIEAAVLLGFAYFVFGTPVAGSLALVAAVVFAGSAAFSGLGVVLGARAENAETVGALVNLVMLPMLVGSGIFFSTAHFPDAVQSGLALLPLTAVNDALRAVILDGAGAREIAPQLGVLGGWAAVTFAVGLKLFRWV